MPTTPIGIAGSVVQADQSVSANSLAQRDSSAGLAVAALTATAISNTGQEKSAVATVTGALALTSAHRIVLADCTSAGFTITLPAVASSANVRYTIIKINSANTLTIQGNGAETINGSNTKTLTTQYTSFNLVCDGTQWLSH
jgi:hypothetical protein